MKNLQKKELPYVQEEIRKMRKRATLIQGCIVASLVSVALIFMMLLFDHPVFNPFRRYGEKSLSVTSCLIAFGIYAFILCLAIFCGWLLRRFLRNMWRCPQCHMPLPMDRVNIGKLTSSMNRFRFYPDKMKDADLLPEISQSCPHCGTVLVTKELIEREQSDTHKSVKVGLVLILLLLCVIVAVILWLLWSLL